MNGSMISDEDPAAVILSPHLDDAVVSCWHVLRGAVRPLVVNFFAGLPPPGPLTLADRIAGVGSAEELVHLRLQEDRAAMEAAGCDAITLDFVEDQYRTEPPLVADLRTALLERIPRNAVLFAPAAIGAHPDHQLIRQMALDLSQEGWTVELWADIPYAVRYGWPEWVTGKAVGPHLNIEAYWADFLREVTAGGHTVRRKLHDLGEDGSEEKLGVMQIYATQFEQLNGGIVDRLRNPLIRRYEVSWEVS